jgi:hypothetical protein
MAFFSSACFLRKATSSCAADRQRGGLKTRQWARRRRCARPQNAPRYPPTHPEARDSSTERGRWHAGAAPAARRHRSPALRRAAPRSLCPRGVLLTVAGGVMECVNRWVDAIMDAHRPWTFPSPSSAWQCSLCSCRRRVPASCQVLLSIGRWCLSAGGRHGVREPPSQLGTTGKCNDIAPDCPSLACCMACCARHGSC